MLLSACYHDSITCFTSDIVVTVSKKLFSGSLSGGFGADRLLTRRHFFTLCHTVMFMSDKWFGWIVFCGTMLCQVLRMTAFHYIAFYSVL